MRPFPSNIDIFWLAVVSKSDGYGRLFNREYVQLARNFMVTPKYFSIVFALAGDSNHQIFFIAVFSFVANPKAPSKSNKPHRFKLFFSRCQLAFSYEETCFQKLEFESTSDVWRTLHPLESNDDSHHFCRLKLTWNSKHISSFFHRALTSN